MPISRSFRVNIHFCLRRHAPSLMLAVPDGCVLLGAVPTGLAVLVGAHRSRRHRLVLTVRGRAGAVPSRAATGAALIGLVHSAPLPCKPYRNRADFRFRADAHVRSEQPDARSYDIMHLSFLQISIGIFPCQIHDYIRRKNLPVVRVSA